MGKKKRHRQLSAQQEIHRALEESASPEGDFDFDRHVDLCQECREDGLGGPDQEQIKSEQKIPNLGAAPGDDAGRDAVHIAVAPVVAAERLQPGQHVGLLDDGRVCANDKAIGIVDPFLVDAVLPGQRLWLFLYPGTVTSFSHVWTHPAFTVKIPLKKDATIEQSDDKRSRE